MRRHRARRRARGLRPVTRWAPLRARDDVLRKADLIRTLAKAYGARSIELFGSAARGEERPGSDLDFMVELEPGRSLLDLIGLGEDLQQALGRRVEAVSKPAMKPRVLARAQRDAIRII
jgi:predicted nucleotidyltransferase